MSLCGYIKELEEEVKPWRKRALLETAVKETCAGYTANMKDAVDVLILGLATQMPGGAHAPKFAWQMMADGQSAICEVPTSRWGMSSINSYGFSSGITDRVRHGGFVSGAQRFGLRQQEVAGITRLHGHHVADGAELFDAFKQNNLHGPELP